MIRHNGSLAKQILYILSKSKMPKKYILDNIERLYGKEFVLNMINSTYLKNLLQSIKYGFIKLIHKKL